MPRTLDECARIWASRRLKLPLERIESVNFHSEPGYYYSEITNADPYCRVTIGTWTRHRKPRLETRDIDVLEEFSDLLNQLVAIAQEGPDLPGEPLVSGFNFGEENRAV